MQNFIGPKQFSGLVALAIFSILFAACPANAQQSRTKSRAAAVKQSRPKTLPLALDRAPMRDAFLESPVYSTDELVAVLQRDTQLRRRYVRHFNMTEARILDFIKNSLIVYNLPSDRVVTNYCITRSGRIYSLRMVFKKGTRVWSTRSGLPVLRWACANPLTKKLPVVLSSRKPELSRKPRVADARPKEVPMEKPDMVQPDITMPFPEPVAPEPVAVETAALASAVPLSGAGSSIAGNVFLPGRGPVLLPLAPLAASSLVATIRPNSPTLGSAPPVPEPGSLTLLGAGLLPLAQRLRRRRQDAKQAPEN